jgi:hypothetical protein
MLSIIAPTASRIEDMSKGALGPNRSARTDAIIPDAIYKLKLCKNAKYKSLINSYCHKTIPRSRFRNNALQTF